MIDALVPPSVPADGVAPGRPLRPFDEAGGGSSWLACPACGWLLYQPRLERNLRVCSECGHHLRLTARQRIALLADADSFEEQSWDQHPADPLAFTDLRPYPERLRDAAQRSGGTESVIAGTCRIGGQRSALLVMDFDFLGGSMGVEAGRRVARIADTALEHRLPLVAVCASGGARMQEGTLSLLQMARTAQAFGRLHDAGLLTVCLLTDPTYGGVSASFATLGSILIAESGAHIGFAGPRVVEQTIRQQLPPGFQTAEFLLAHGLIDRVEDRGALRPLLTRLLQLHQPAGARPGAGPAGASVPAGGATTANATPAPDPAATGDGAAAAGHPDGQDSQDSQDAWDVVQSARDVARPTTLDYLDSAFDDFIELHGDRMSADDPAIVGGLARVGGHTVVVIGHQKGHTVKELVARNFGMPHPEGYRKAIRLLDHAERFGLPVVTLIDTPGAHPGLAAEERGQSVAIAETILRINRISTGVVSIVIGEGGSGGALALSSADRLLMLSNSYLSVITPEGCAAILWRSAGQAPQAARALHLMPSQLLRLGVASAVIPEPPGGARSDSPGAAAALRAALLQELPPLLAMSPASLLAGRAQRLDALDPHTPQGPAQAEESDDRDR